MSDKHLALGTHGAEPLKKQRDLRYLREAPPRGRSMELSAAYLILFAKFSSFERHREKWGRESKTLHDGLDEYVNTGLGKTYSLTLLEIITRNF